MTTAEKYRNSAALARSNGDPYTATWLDQQADILDAQRDEAERVAEWDVLKGSPDHCRANG